MTLIKPSAPLRRETATVYRHRALIVELHPGYLTIREKGRRQAVPVDYRTILEAGYKILAREARIEKLAKKKGKR